MSTSWHPQTDGQTERMNRWLEDMLRQYVSPNQDDWDQHLAAAEFACNNAWDESRQETPFFLNYGQHPRLPLSLQKSPVAGANQFVEALQHALTKAKACLARAKSRMKVNADKRRPDTVYHVTDQVLLSMRNITLVGPGTPKLWPKWLGPFSVTRKIGDVAYELALPKTMRIHNVFHVSLLKPYRADGRVQPPPPPTVVNQLLEYEVERILDHRAVKRGKRNKFDYLVRWLGYGPEHNTWEPESSLRNSQDLLTEYWKRLDVPASSRPGPNARASRLRRRHASKRQRV